MLRPRIIVYLLVKDGGLVKTVGFGSPKYVGDPINVVRIFNEKVVDELVVLDIDATVHGREPDYRMIENLAAESRMPLGYGGGVRSVEQAKRIVGLGVEKVAISAAGIADPGLLTAIASEIGAQSVVVVLDFRRKAGGNAYEVWTHNGTVNTKRLLPELAAELEARGAGEIVVNSIEKDGTMKGYDLEAAAQVRQVTHVPMTVVGGAGSLEDVGELIRRFGVVGAGAGSMFVFKGVYRAVLVNYPKLEERDRIIDEFRAVGQ